MDAAEQAARPGLRVDASSPDLRRRQAITTRARDHAASRIPATPAIRPMSGLMVRWEGETLRIPRAMSTWTAFVSRQYQIPAAPAAVAASRIRASTAPDVPRSFII